MRRVKFYFLIASLLCFSVLLGVGNFRAFADSPKLSDTWAEFVDSGSMPGCVLITATPTSVLSVECVGWADIAARKPMRDDTFFWIASNSKAVIAAAVMICVEEGLLDLDVPVENYIPDLKNLKVGREQEDGTIVLSEPASKVTLRRALSHTGGFRFITVFQERYGIDSLPVGRLMTVVGQTPLIDEPGARYSYSNLGIDVGEAAVEAVTKKPIEQFLQERIFEPLGMNDTTFFPSEEQMKRAAVPYTWDSENSVLKPYRYDQTPSMDDGSPRYAEGGGGLFSTPKDFVKFYQMLAGKGVGANGRRILSEKSVEEMTSKQTGDSVDANYGFGIVSGDAPGHGGAYCTDCFYYRDGSIVAVYMVAVSAVPKQGDAKNAYREYVENVRRSLMKD